MNGCQSPAKVIVPERRRQWNKKDKSHCCLFYHWSMSSNGRVNKKVIDLKTFTIILRSGFRSLHLTFVTGVSKFVKDSFILKPRTGTALLLCSIWLDRWRQTLLSAVSLGPLVHPGSHCFSPFFSPWSKRENKLNCRHLHVTSLDSFRSEIWHFFPSVQRWAYSFFPPQFLNKRRVDVSLRRRWIDVRAHDPGSDEEDLLVSSGCWHLTLRL